MYPGLTWKEISGLTTLMRMRGGRGFHPERIPKTRRTVTIGIFERQHKILIFLRRAHEKSRFFQENGIKTHAKHQNA